MEEDMYTMIRFLEEESNHKQCLIVINKKENKNKNTTHKTKQIEYQFTSAKKLSCQPMGKNEL